MAVSSAVLPDAAREQAWRLLWQRLLQEPPNPDDSESDDTEPNEHDDEERPDEAA